MNNRDLQMKDYTAEQAAQAYEKFGRWVAETVCDADNWGGDFDGMEAMEEMERLGIIEHTTYDPAKHGELYFAVDPDPGDEVQVFAPGMTP